jgi:hypothetical protein
MFCQWQQLNYTLENGLVFIIHKANNLHTIMSV